MRRRAAPGSVLAANVRVVPGSGGVGGVLRGVVDRVLSAIGEQRQNEFRAGDAERLLEESGWTVTRQASSRPNRLDGGSYLHVLSSRPSPD